MKVLRVVNANRGTSLGTRIGLADTWWTRLRGLLGAPRLQEGEGLLIRPCNGVHMYGMKQSLDVAFLAGDGSVVAMYHDLRPGRRSKWHSPAHDALELPPGTLNATATEVGDVIRVEPAED